TAKAAPAALNPADWLLLPTPREMTLTGAVRDFGSTPWTYPQEYSLGAQYFAEEITQVPETIHALSAATAELARLGAGSRPSPLHTRIDPAAMPHPEGYVLTIAPEGAAGITIVAHDEAGVFYAAQTLKQLAQLATRNKVIPACRIVDWPDFPNRGVMIDVARNKVPEIDSLYELVDLLASWKVNQLQMYTEHTFAYTNHHVVWEDASPMTPAQIRDLDAYCKARFIQLVPNQNSFGHMWRWLMHPEYAHLAETDDKTDLCPVDPGSIALIGDMYNDLLPCFSSPYANVGCDETWTLGKGRSKAACEAQGEGRVYLGFLMQIRELVKSHGKTMQFWADIINNHPELIPELPKDVVAMEWGYEANHPFDTHCKRFKDSGVRFYVVPGTSTWNSLLGRHENAMANLRNAAENGMANGGEGYLVTDWGDGGHWQFLPVSYLTYAYGVSMAWCVETNKDINIEQAADLYAFRDDAGVMSAVARDLGNAYKQAGAEFGNNTTFYLFLQHAIEKPLKDIGLAKVTAADLQGTIDYIDAALARLDGAKMNHEDGEFIKEQFRMNAAMAKLACRIGIARIEAGGVATSKVPKDVRAKLAAELEPLIPKYRQLWLVENRSGGLKESSGIFENVLALLKQP
ncbi:MAG: family 20 glycosylhydrolase, partial [FCB group bacterium]|nr:family 20 glycosylhydrolase [FCB group bacterium]